MQEVVDHILSIIINSGRDEATTNCSVGALTSKEILHHYGTSNIWLIFIDYGPTKGLYD